MDIFKMGKTKEKKVAQDTPLTTLFPVKISSL